MCGYGLKPFGDAGPGLRLGGEGVVELLQTMPGIGAYAAVPILRELGGIHRFPDSRHLCSYVGRMPSVHASGGKTRLGRLMKQGVSWFRWILVELFVYVINDVSSFGASPVG